MSGWALAPAEVIILAPRLALTSTGRLDRRRCSVEPQRSTTDIAAVGTEIASVPLKSAPTDVLVDFDI